MKKMYIGGKGTSKYNKTDYENYTPEETANCIIDTLSKITACSVEDVVVCLKKAFQEKIVFNPDDDEDNVILFRPDEMTIYFRGKFGAAGTFEVVKEDIDEIFKGETYTLSEFTEQELEALNISDSFARWMKKATKNLLSQIATGLEFISLDTLDMSSYAKPPIEVYAELLKCDDEALLNAIFQCVDTKAPSEIAGVGQSKVVVSEEQHLAYVFNITDKIAGAIPLKVLFEVNEDEEGFCPCPTCWNARHLGELTPEKPTLH